MTSGPCVFGCGFQADLDGHYASFHRMKNPAPPPSPPPKISEPSNTVSPIPLSTPTSDRREYCYNCGHKLGAQTWKEVVIVFIRYQLMVFWIGSFVGALSGFEIAARIFGH